MHTASLAAQSLFARELLINRSCDSVPFSWSIPSA